MIRQLTYDAGFKFEGDTYRLNGGYFIVSVTSLPELQSAALEACKDSLRSLLGQGGISEGNVDAAKRSLYNRLARDSASTQYLVGQLLMADVSSNIDIEAVTVEVHIIVCVRHKFHVFLCTDA